MGADENFRRIGGGLSVAPAGNYLPCVKTGKHLYVSGMLPRNSDGLTHRGKLGVLSKEDGYAAARNATLYGLHAVRNELGTLDRVSRVLGVSVFVNSLPEFTEISYVANGASDLLVEIFGDAGKHSRTAVGVSALPLDAAVEISMLLELRE
ncbi:MAG: RidA family protein [Thermoplasmata archaeon]|nr:RidA family protein [Thermoplasmata archaeon]